MTTRRPLLALALVAPLLLITSGGCTGIVRRVAVRQAVGELDEAFALGDAQKEQAEASVNRLIDEVPTLVLPDLGRLVAEVDRVLASGATEERLLALERGGDALADRVAGRVIDELAPLLASLSEAQIDHAAAWSRENLDEKREELDEPAAERLEERQDAFVEWAEKWAGDLSSGQARAIRRHIAGLPDESALRLAADERRLESLERALRAHPGEPALRAVVWNLWATREELGPGAPSPAERRARGRATMIFVDSLMTAPQRDHAREHLEGEYARLRRFLGGAG